MRAGYLDCFSGVSGNMMLGALVGAGAPFEAIRSALASLPVEGYELCREQVSRCGIAATLVRVELDRQMKQPHRNLDDVLSIIRRGELSPEQRGKAGRIFRSLAEAEALVHGVESDEVHFHEVGAVDAICDVVGTVVGLGELDLEALFFSPVSLGGGMVETEHGNLPVPAPSTAELLKGISTRGGPVEVELATPTGAVLLKVLGRPSPTWPQMRVETLSYGAGSRDLEELPNVLRLAVGQMGDAAETDSDVVWVLEANLDDMTGEQMGFCTERLLAEGALDVFSTPIQMKKGRPAFKLTVLCEPQGLRRMERIFWRHSSTLGVRRSLWQRSKLRREVKTVQTRWGPVQVKLAYLGGDRIRSDPEYEDCRRIAEERNLPLEGVYAAARQALEEQRRGEGP